MGKKKKPVRASTNPHKGAGGRTPRSEHNIQPEKRPRTSVAISDTDFMKRAVQFTFSDADLEGQWPLSEMSAEHAKGLFPFLKSIESMTVGQLVATSDLYVEYPNFGECPTQEAPNRLAELYGSADNVCRLRVTGKQRLYALRFEHRLALLWWDPEHEIWPSRKRNT